MALGDAYDYGYLNIGAVITEDGDAIDYGYVNVGAVLTEDGDAVDYAYLYAVPYYIQLHRGAVTALAAGESSARLHQAALAVLFIDPPPPDATLFLPMSILETRSIIQSSVHIAPMTVGASLGESRSSVHAAPLSVLSNLSESRSSVYTTPLSVLPMPGLALSAIAYVPLEVQTLPPISEWGYIPLY